MLAAFDVLVMMMMMMYSTVGLPYDDDLQQDYNMMILMTSSENNSSGVFIIDLITGEFFIYALDIDKDIVMDLKYENSD